MLLIFHIGYQYQLIWQKLSVKSDIKMGYRTHTNSEPGHYFHARHLEGLVIEFSARDLLLEKVFYFDGKKYD